MGTLTQTPLNGRERHRINGAGWTAAKPFPLHKTEIKTSCLQIG